MEIDRLMAQVGAVLDGHRSHMGVRMVPGNGSDEGTWYPLMQRVLCSL